MSFEPLSERNVAARKEYICVWCGEKVKVGEKHWYDVSKFEGRLQQHRIHQECKIAMGNYDWCENDNEFNPHGYVRGTCVYKFESQELERRTHVSV